MDMPAAALWCTSIADALLHTVLVWWLSTYWIASPVELSACVTPLLSNPSLAKKGVKARRKFWRAVSYPLNSFVGTLYRLRQLSVEKTQWAKHLSSSSIGIWLALSEDESLQVRTSCRSNSSLVVQGYPSEENRARPLAANTCIVVSESRLICNGCSHGSPSQIYRRHLEYRSVGIVLHDAIHRCSANIV